MTLPRSVADVLDERVRLEIESIDRMYLNVYQPRLQYGGGVAAFFVGHRGYKYASSVLMQPITDAFVANIHHYIAANNLDLVRLVHGCGRPHIFCRLRRHDLVACPSLWVFVSPYRWNRRDHGF